MTRKIEEDTESPTEARVGNMHNTMIDTAVVAIILFVLAGVLWLYDCGNWVYIPLTYSYIYLLISLLQFFEWKQVMMSMCDKAPA